MTDEPILHTSHSPLSTVLSINNEGVLGENTMQKCKFLLELLLCGPRVHLPFAVTVLLVSTIAMLPLITMLIFVAYMKDVFIAMLVMHWACMTLCPCIFTFCVYGNFQFYYVFWRLQTLRICKQVIPALISFLVGAALTLSAFIFIKCKPWNEGFCVQMKQRAYNVGFDKSFSVLVILGAYFAAVNPVIEEIFWRVFLFKEMFYSFFLIRACSSVVQQLRQESRSTGNKISSIVLPVTEKTPLKNSFTCCLVKNLQNADKKFESVVGIREITTDDGYARIGVSSGEIVEAIAQNAERENSYNTHNCIQQILQAHDNIVDANNYNENIDEYVNLIQHRYSEMSFKKRLLLSSVYVSYHSVVIFYLLGLAYTFPVCLFLAFFGVILIWMIQNPAFGIFSAIFAHAGVNVAVVVIYADIYFDAF